MDTWCPTLLLLTFCLTLTTSLRILHSFRDPDDFPFQKLALQDSTGSVFIGCTNRLHKLTANLTLVQSAATGPREDNPECPPPLLPCDKPKTPTDSLTKVLLVKDDSVILCTSLFYGHCQILQAGNITVVSGFNEQPIVPNDQSSCVAFLAPANKAGKEILYIGAEFSNLGLQEYRELVPSISGREPSTLELIYRDSEGASKKSIMQELRNDFRVKFVYGFPHGDYAYFITVQKKDLRSKELVSRISRICKDDNYFRSYVEIPIQCQGDVISSDFIATSGFLMKGKLFVSFFSPSKSVSHVCAYPLSDVDKEMDKTVRECYQGLGKVGPAHYETVRTCMPSSSQVDFCAATPVSIAYPSLIGQKGVMTRSFLELDTDQITSLSLAMEAGQQMVHVGTDTGQILKYLLQGHKGTLLTTASTGVSEPVVDIVNGGNPERLYVLTSTKVSLLSTNMCEHHTTCEDCVGGKDQICGWCVMENRCSAQLECPSSVVTPHWLAASTDSCISMADVKPTAFSYQSLKDSNNDNKLSFQLDPVSLESSDDLDLGCVYRAGSAQHTTAASIVDQRMVTCPLPDNGQIPQIPSGKDHQQLSVHFRVKGKSIVTRSVPIYNCDVHQSCSKCVKSTFNCQWCYASGKCREQSQNCTAVKGQKVTGIQKEDKCPQIWTQSTDASILVHSGQERQIAVGVLNLQDILSPQPDQDANVVCAFSYGGKDVKVKGTISSKTLSCETVKFSYDEESPFVAAKFKVTWGPNNLPLDNPTDIQVRIYKCKYIAAYCGQCLSMDPEYDCGWCQSCNDSTKCPGSCNHESECPSSSWNDRSSTCANPQITRFSPGSGPIKGATLISVSGINLGKEYSDLIASVGGRACTVKSENYEDSIRFVCEAGQVDVESSGNISVTVDQLYTAVSDSAFYFVDPVLNSLTPKAGPKSGGTSLYLHGDHLDAGSDVAVKMEGGMCEVIKRNKTTIVCKTPSQPDKNPKVKVEVSFGGYRKEVPDRFEFKPDPTVSMLQPLKTILSGGTSITVRGDSLDLIQKPEFVTKHDGRSFTAGCEVVSTNIMECKVPAVTADVNVTETNPLEVQYGFNMDDVAEVKNLSTAQPEFKPMLYYPDPYVAPFDVENQEKKFQEGEWLFIEGHFRMVNVLVASVHIYVGDELCSKISVMNNNVIRCEPPSNAPPGTNSNGKAPVVVQIGNMKSNPGFLVYKTPHDKDKPIALGVVLGVVLPIIFIIILLTVCVIKRHRKHKPSQNYIPDVLKDYEGRKEGEEDVIGMDNMPIKVDMNGGQLDANSDSTPYINELLGKFQEPVLRQNIASALISRKKLEIGDLIGKGYYGVVYKAVYGHPESDKQVNVAVKTLQARRSEAEALQQFLQDVAMVRDLSHPNLLPVVGACVSPSDDPIVVMPFMATEDLGSYVREPAKSLSTVQLLSFSHQIAQAMAYLENLRIVHRNLASRNCIVIEEEGKPETIKLTDYVVSGSLFSHDFYVENDGTTSQLVRWMAPESVETFTFSSASDVWSYGVVTWEILTRGVEPYPNLKAQEVVIQVKEGKRLPSPKHCSQNVYQIMTSCWSFIPEERPSFVQLLEKLSPYVSGDDETEDLESQPLTSSVDVGGADEYPELNTI